MQTKPRAMPVHDGSRSDQDERLPPPGPARFQRNPEQFVQGRQSMARSLHTQSQQLSTESQVFKDEVLRERKGVTIDPRRCRSDTFMQESCRKTSNPAVRQVIYFVGVRRFGEAQPLFGKSASGQILWQRMASRLVNSNDPRCSRHFITVLQDRQCTWTIMPST
jgi:hypothetical protein